MKKIIKLAMLMLSMTASVSAMAEDCSFVPASLTAETGTVANLEVGMTNTGFEVISFQFDLYLPDGVSVEKDAYDALKGTLSSRVKDHTVSIKEQEDGGVRFLVFSNNNLTITGNEGLILTIPLVVEAAQGNYEITIKNGEINDPSFTQHFPPTGTCTLTVTAQEEVRYGDNQLYVKDIAITEGENAVMSIGYNSDSDVYNFFCNIVLPENVTPGDVIFADKMQGTNLTTEGTWDASTRTLKIEGFQKKSAIFPEGDEIIATVELSTASLSAGRYTIKVTDQSLENAADEPYTLDEYEAYLDISSVGEGLALVDGIAYTGTSDYSNVDVTYTRTFNNTEWQPLYVPFNMSYDEWSPYADVAQVANIRCLDEDGDEVVDNMLVEFNKLTSGEITPNVPYVIRAKATGETTFECTGKTVLAAPAEEGYVDCSSTTLTFTFYGVYTEKTDLYQTGGYHLSGGEFHHAATEAAVLPPYRFYLMVTPRNNGYTQTSLPARIKVIVDGDDTTSSILGIESEVEGETIYFDLTGRMVKNPSKGIYIQNGKKVYIK